MAISFRPLKAEEVDVRVGTCNEKGVALLLFKDARCDMALLDEVVGPENWECSYESIDNKLFCTVSVLVDRDGGLSQWVSKQDVGVPSNMEATKGEASDAFKRACFKWGIGRELYTAPKIWVDRKLCKKIQKGRNGKEQCYDDFVVTDFEVDDGKIVKLTICNASNRMAVVYGNGSKKQGRNATQKPREAAGGPEPKNDALRVAYKKMGDAIESYCERHGMDPAAAKEGVRKRPEWASQCKSLEYIQAVTREFEEA